MPTIVPRWELCLSDEFEVRQEAIRLTRERGPMRVSSAGSAGGLFVVRIWLLVRRTFRRRRVLRRLVSSRVALLFFGQSFVQTPMIVPIPGVFDDVKMLMKGDCYSARQRGLGRGLCCNHHKVR